MMPHVIRDDGARLKYETRGATGVSAGTFVFLHGMGGSRQQPLGYVTDHSQVDIITMDARGHGDSSDLVGTSHTSFDSFADDVIALLDHMGRRRAIIGGISMGAGVALNAAIRYPERVSALILCRPAWLETAQDKVNTSAYGHIADLLDSHDVDQALRLLLNGPPYLRVLQSSRAAASSLRNQVTRPRAAINSDMLRQLPASTPAPNLADWSAIDVPTLVIGHRDDPLHPWNIAALSAERIRNAQLVEVPSRDADPEFQRLIAAEVSSFFDAQIEVRK